MIPAPVYPLAIDSDKTLFNVLNSTQSILRKDISETDVEIELDTESFPDNGFVTINKEIIYYEDKSETKLLNCIRGVEKNIQKHKKGTLALGTILAQHHNQLVDAIIQLENIIGNLENLNLESPKNLLAEPTLHGAMALLSAAPPISDDACPDVDFTFNVLSVGPTVAEFCVRIYGDYLTYKLDFGDGSFTTTQFAGTHTYSGAVNPVATVTSTNCSITQQPTTTEDSDLTPDLPEPSVPFSVQIPPIPDFPSFIAPQSTKNCPGPLFNLPPIIIPQVACSQISGSGCNISIDGFAIPSHISLVGCCIPSQISFVCCSVPSVISFSPAPSVSVNWGTPPLLSCVVSVQCPSATSLAFGESALNEEESLNFAEPQSVQVTYEDLGIPREIKVTHDIPNSVRLPDVRVIDTIPEFIHVDASEVPKIIKVQNIDVPDTIFVRLADDFPKYFEMRAVGIPEKLEVVGIPSIIEVKMIMPENPTVEMVYKGAPIDLNIHVDISKNLNEIVIAK